MANVKEVLDIMRDSLDFKTLLNAVKRIPDLEQRIAVLERKLANDPSASRACDHCASLNTEPAGRRDSPNFPGMGLKEAIYLCKDCGQTSYFELPLA